MKGPEPASTRIVRPWPRRSKALTGVRTGLDSTPSGARSVASIGKIPTSNSDTVQPFVSKHPTLYATNRCGVAIHDKKGGPVRFE